jgi:hypothetical protein
MLGLSVLVAVVLAVQARLPREYDTLWSRVVVSALCYAQPLVRSFQRYRTWLTAFPVPVVGEPDPENGKIEAVPPWGGKSVGYWSEDWRHRTELLAAVVAYLSEHRWSFAVDSGWSAWDFEASGNRYTAVRVRTVQEDHGSGKRLIRVKYRVSPHGTFWLAALVGVAATAAVAVVTPALAVAPAAVAGLGLGWAWYRGLRTAGQVARVVDKAAATLKMIRCDRSTAADP